MTDDERDAMVEGVYKAALEVFEEMERARSLDNMAELITEGVRKATLEWLDENKEDVLAAIKSAHS